MDLSPSPLRPPFTVEKWYNTVIGDGGEVLLVTFETAGVAIVGDSVVRASYFPASKGDGEVSGAVRAAGVMGDGRVLQFGTGRIDGDRLFFSTPGVAGEAVFKLVKRPASAMHTVLIDEPKRNVEWAVELSHARVDACVRFGKVERRFSGWIFRDRFRMSGGGFLAGLEELEFGHACGADESVAWLSLRCDGQRYNAGWRNGAADTAARDHVTIAESRVLGGSREFIHAQPRARLLQQLKRKLSGDAREEAFAGTALVGDKRAIVFHATVRWPGR